MTPTPDTPQGLRSKARDRLTNGLLARDDIAWFDAAADAWEAGDTRHYAEVCRLTKRIEALRKRLEAAANLMARLSLWAHEMYEVDGRLVDGGIPEDAALLGIVRDMDAALAAQVPGTPAGEET